MLDEATRQRARDFGARDAYQRFPAWNVDLEHRIMGDWALVFPESWLDVREFVMEGWDTMHDIVAPGEPLHPFQ
jgi:hypothetical protein